MEDARESGGRPPEPGGPATRRTSAVHVTGLRKSYGHVRALQGVTLEIGVGERFAILGPNGAGKTTLIEILEGLRTPDDGSVRVFGLDLRPNIASLRSRIGVTMQSTALPPLLTVREMIRLYAAIYPKSMPVDDALALVALEEKRDAQVRSLSGGQLQRLAIALALVGLPEILFLDEPTSGLDPQARHLVWDILRGERTNSSSTVVMTTHQMDEAEQLCDRVAIIDHGVVLAIGSPARLVEEHCPGHFVRFETARAAAFLKVPGTIREAMDGDRVAVEIETLDLEATMATLMAARSRRKLEIDSLRVERASLEDVFLSLTGRSLRDT